MIAIRRGIRSLKFCPEGRRSSADEMPMKRVYEVSKRYAVAIASALILTMGVLFYLLCVHHVEPYWIVIEWNRRTGEMRLDTEAIWYITPPWVMAIQIDIRPQRVCVTSAGRGVFNCKLVKFEPTAYKEFVAVEGLRYYWFANRISFNLGYEEEYRGFRDIMRGYAFSAKKYKFITILKE